MKICLFKSLLLIVAVLIGFLSFTASSNDKLSVNTKMFLLQRTDTAEIHNNFTLANPKVVNGVEYIDCFIYLTEMSLNKLESLGVIITDKYRTFVTARVPVNKIEEIANLNCVKQVDVSTMMKQLHILTNSDKVVSNEIWRNNTRDVPSEYTGKDVVIGIVDVGIQFNHIAFLDANGNSRVKAVYMPCAQDANGGSTVVIDGITMNGYQYTTPSQIANLNTDEVHYWGGTYSAGCAAGSVVDNFSGIAPESDIVLCGCGSVPFDSDSLSSNTYHLASGTDLVNSVKYIANYAHSVNKPCVIYMPYGSALGPHDGTSELAYDEIAEQYGVTIIMPTWDLADVPRFATSNKNRMLVIHKPISGTRLQGVCDIWKTNDSSLDFKFIVFDKNTGNAVRIISTSSLGVGESLTVNASRLGFSSGSIYVTQDLNNNRRHMNISADISIPENKILTYSFYGEAYVYSDGPAQLETDVVFQLDKYNEQFCPGQFDGAINNAVCGKKSISVGAFASDEICNGPSCSGDVVSYSGYGTDYNGFNHPFITAPGLNIISSANGYCEEDYPFSTDINGQTYYWSERSGTTPAASVATGVVALYLQAAPWLDVDGIKDVIQHSASNYTNASSPPKQRGNGIINVLAGLQYIIGNHAEPTIIVRPDTLMFSGYVNETYTQTFIVKGYYLNDNINISKSGSNVFSVTPTTITPEEALNGVEVNVVCSSPNTVHQTGSITFTSSGAESKTVQLNFHLFNHGSASDRYLNIADCASIDEAGANVSGMNSIYKYTEYANEKCAWLTISNYGAMKADANQNWYVSATSSLTQQAFTWTATDVFQGANAYFGGNNDRGYSIYGSGTQTFYVTNCAQAKVYVGEVTYNTSNAKLTIYECTLNDDGTITPATTATDTKQGRYGVIASESLDPAKIYMVQLTGGGYYSHLLEIGFKTDLIVGIPTNLQVDPADVSADLSWTAGENNTGWNLRWRLYDPNAVGEEEVTFFESFEDGLGNWTLIDSDGDGNNWRQFNPNNFSNVSFDAYDGDYTAMSRSWQGDALTPDQWMISPLINDLGGTLKYYIVDDGKNYRENYRIYVSTTGKNISDFVPVTDDMLSPNSTEWTEVTIDLSSYSGQAGYIAFRHYNCTDQDFMLIDAVSLTSKPAASWNYVNDVASPFTITGLTPATTYETQVQGKNEYGTSGWTASTIFTTLATQTQGLAGDVNGDGLVTAADITALYDLMLNNDSSHIVNGDQTGDGIITAADITAVYTIMLGNQRLRNR